MGEEYNIVVEYKNGPLEGGRSWTTYASKVDFESKKEKLLGGGRLRIVAQGVSIDKAIEICDNAPLIRALKLSV